MVLSTLNYRKALHVITQEIKDERNHDEHPEQPWIGSTKINVYSSRETITVCIYFLKGLFSGRSDRGGAGIIQHPSLEENCIQTQGRNASVSTSVSQSVLQQSVCNLSASLITHSSDSISFF